MDKCLKKAAVLLACALLAACGGVEEEKTAEKEAALWSRQDEALLQVSSDPGAVSGMQAEASSDEQDSEGGVSYYAFDTLETQEERYLYQEIYSSLTGWDRETELSTLSVELIDPVFQCVMADHPEIFYVDGYTSTTYKLGDSLKKITFSGDFTMEEETAAGRAEQLEEAAGRWMEGMPQDADDYETVKYLYEYLIVHTDYENGAQDSQNICSVLLNGRSVCQGYAKALQWLCQRAGIPALLVTGRANGGGHAWIAVMADGEWYHVDPTWGDASYLGGEGDYPETAYPSVNYDYFCVTTKQIERTHEIEDARKIPVCTAVEDQYYRREGLYLESADAEQIERIFRDAASAGQTTVSFQCADDSVFDRVYELLIGEQKVFDYLPGADGRAVYVDSRKQRTFSFWLSS